MKPSLLIADFTGMYEAEGFLQSLQDRRVPYRQVRLGDIEGTCCYCDPEAEAEISRRLEPVPKERVRWIDSGDYHYVTKILAARERSPFTLVLVDNHPDDQAPVFGGVLMGGGIGLLLRAGGSSGGTDIPALILNKYFHLNVSVLLYVIDGLVLCSQAFFSSIEQILYGIFVLALFTMTMNRIMLMGKSQIQLFIISDESETIRQQILAEDAGATMFYVEKAYTGKQGKCIMCVIPRRKLYPITQLISVTDPDAFFTISEVNEVRGAGFSFAKHYLDTTEKQQLSAK